MKGAGLLALALAITPLGGCQSMTGDRPARLQAGDSASLANLRAGLAAALGRARVELGADDPARGAVVSVLPAPLGPMEGRSVAAPAVFDLRLRGGACHAIARADGKAHPLPGVACVPLRGGG